MWTDIARRQHSRAGLRYPSDLRDAEWALIEPLLPTAKPGGRPRSTDLREVDTRNNWGPPKTLSPKAV
jgi:putative transposase